jgi:hypothetical protein
MRKNFLSSAILPICVVAFFAAVYLTIARHFADPDGYYHARLASMLVHGQIGSTFPWLSYTTWGQTFADQHYLYHLLLAPFVGLSALHWSVVVFSSGAVLTFVFLLRQFRINPWLWTFFLLVGSADFLFRVTLVKANTLSLVWLFLTVLLLEKKKYAWLLLTSALFVWTYGGFVFLPFIAGAYTLVSLFNSEKAQWRPLLYMWGGVCGGILIGLLSHPQFPNILSHLYFQIFQAGLGAGGAVQVGAEWASYQFLQLVKTNFVVLAVWLASSAVFLWHHKKPSTRTAQSLFFISFGFFFLMLKSRRFVEYWAPFALLFSAHIWSPYFKKIDWAYFKRMFAEFWQLRLSVLLSLLVLAAAAWPALAQVRSYYSSAQPDTLYLAAAQWLVANSTQGEIVFNTQWDQFPQLFYWDKKNYYIIGMDPTFMYLHSPDLYGKWRLVSDDRSGSGSNDTIYAVVKNDFRASYIFVENRRNPQLNQYLSSAGQADHFREAYRDDAVTIYRVQ